MQLQFGRFELRLTHTWTIANKLGPGGGGGMDDFPVALVTLRDRDGLTGLGEAAPSNRYDETVESSLALLQQVDPSRLSFEDISGSMAYIEGLMPGHYAPKGALNMALLDGAARRDKKPLHSWLGLPFAEQQHCTSFSIGIDAPDIIRRKVAAASDYPVLKLKVGVEHDRENFDALRSVAPRKTVRVDANEAWKTREDALRHIEWLAADGHVEFLEQPMPASTPLADLAWLKERSPLPLFADESYCSAADIQRCAEGFHGVNVKLVKTGGVTRAKEALETARQAGLQTMIGCMIETSVLISAAAHLAALADFLDLDGNLLTSNDPYRGVTAAQGMLSFAQTNEPFGLRVTPRNGSVPLPL